MKPRFAFSLQPALNSLQSSPLPNIWHPAGSRLQHVDGDLPLIPILESPLNYFVDTIVATPIINPEFSIRFVDEVVAI
jgi:hypothetical protein